MSALAQFGVGFLIALNLGAILGFIGEWNRRALSVIMLVVAAVAAVSLIASSTASGTSDAVVWPMLIGTIPGYMAGFHAGTLLYTECWSRPNGVTAR